MNKIIRGCWQLAGGHSERGGDIAAILDAAQSGFTTFDCADIYLGVEELLGRASNALLPKKLQIHTKFVPDLDSLETLDRSYVESIIDRSLKRLQVDSLDLVQFHWWDWNCTRYLVAMDYLFELKAKGKIANIGLTNVNTDYLKEFLERFEIASIQVQLSLFDRRAERGLLELCRKNNVKLFAYGSLLGGFIHEKWIDRPEPQLEDLANRSLVKYKLLIEAACGWDEFQKRLLRLQQLAKYYSCDIPAIALGALLQAGKADSLIVGLSSENFYKQNRSLAHLPLLKEHDLHEISSWECNLSGDVYEEERDHKKTHAQVMRYNLNKLALNTILH